MYEVTCDRVCLIYSLIRDDVDLNVGTVIFAAMKRHDTIRGTGKGLEA